MNIIFFGNWGLASLVLEKIANNNNIKILCVVTQFDESSSDLFFNAVYDTANQLNIKVFEKVNLIPEHILQQTNLGLSVSFSEIFKKEFLSNFKILNVHPSKLPIYRGPSPIQWQIKDGLEKIGVTIHFINENIDEGEIYAQKEFIIDYSQLYSDLLDNLNVELSDWVSTSMSSFNFYKKNILKKIPTGTLYYHRINIPNVLKSKKLSIIKSFLKRERLVLFSGNRAEFGITLPLIEKLSKIYNIDLILSGAHTLRPWMTKDEVYATINEKKLSINVIEITPKEIKDHYRDNFNINFNFGINFLKKYADIYPISMVIILGDRVESYAFANASFFSQVPICHLFGGDISNVPYFDTNIRHAITKISNLHFTSNNQSLKNLLRMGEESWRCFNMGNISLNNYTNGNYSNKEEILNKYNLRDKKTLLFTYHPSQFISISENFNNFYKVYKILIKIPAQLIITYPNNDEGHQDITSFLELQPRNSENILVVKSLGIKDYLGIIKEMDCIVVGNSSSGLFETAFTSTPAINIGDRQTDRPRACNVSDIEIKDISENLEKSVLNILKNYDTIKIKNRKEYDFFGKGDSVNVVVNGIEMFLQKTKEKQTFKKFNVKN